MYTPTLDEVLSTTRSVRKRLDTARPVPLALLVECLELAFQAPNGSNMNTWEWVVVDDPGQVRAVGALYNTAFDKMLVAMGDQVGENYIGAKIPGAQKISESVDALRESIEQMPAIVIPLMAGRPEGQGVFMQACLWGSILQAVWSFFLALRARSLGSAWTTAHLNAEAEMADLLGIPFDHYTQVGLFPVAYTLGTDFKKAWRKPAGEVVSWNRFGQRS